VLYEAVKDNLATLLEEASEVGRGLPRYVERDARPVPGVRRAGEQPRVEPLLREWILRLLSDDPEARGTAAQVAQALEAAAKENVPELPAEPQKRPERVRPPARAWA
jgi:hypothetical protein